MIQYCYTATSSVWQETGVPSPSVAVERSAYSGFKLASLFTAVLQAGSL